MGRPRPEPRPPTTEAERVRSLLEYALRTFGSEYQPDPAFRELGGDPHMLEFFVPWALYHYRVRGKSVAWHYLDAMARRFPAVELVALMRPAGALLSIWEVVESHPGEGLRLRDLVAGYDEVVTERTASRALRRWQVILARVSHGREPRVFGLHPRTLPPRQGAVAADAVARALGGRPGRAAKSRLQAPDAADLLVRAWEQETFEHCDFSPPPKIVNTDGEPLRPTLDTLAVAVGARDGVAARLKGLPGAIADEDAPGRLRVSFTRPGNAMNSSWTNTIVGRADLDADHLVLETNSEARADVMRGIVEAACGPALRHLGREVGPPPEVPAAGGPGVRGEMRPEHLPILREFKLGERRSWPDTPIPILGDLTPREASRNRKRRRDLVLLLKEIEYVELGLPAEERLDPELLWKELGMARPV